jgi:hypothetical protein
MKTFIICTLHQIKEYGMGSGECNTNGRDEEFIHGFYGKTWRQKSIWKTYTLEGSVISKWILKELGERVWDGLNWLRIGSSWQPPVKNAINLLLM